MKRTKRPKAKFMVGDKVWVAARILEVWPDERKVTSYRVGFNYAEEFVYERQLTAREKGER